MTMNICKLCNNELPLSAFYLKDKRNNRYDSTCKECRKLGASAWHQENREQSLENKKKWHQENKEEAISKMRQRYHNNIDEEKKQRKIWRKENPDRVKAWNQKAYKKNQEKILSQKKVYAKLNKDKINAYKRNRYQNNFGYRMEMTNRLRLREVLKGKTKDVSSKECVGCTVDYLQAWIRFQFYDGMTTNNHGEYWHLDHVKPCESFDLTKTDQLKECFHWSNIQPLRWDKNIKKSDKIDPRMIILQQLKAHVFETKVWPEIKKLLQQPRYFLYEGEVLYDDLDD